MGDASAYEKIRTQLLPGLVTVTDSMDVAGEIRTLILRPMNAPADSIESAADRAIASATGPGTREWLYLLQGFYRARQSNYVSALELLDKANFTPSIHASFRATLAVARSIVIFRLGRLDEARAGLAQGAAILKENWFSPQRGALEDGWWMDWLAADIFLREAQELIEGQTTKSPSRAQ
jgi:hypothetical protein